MKKNLPIFFLIFIFFVLYSFVGIQKHYHFQTFGWDTAIFDQQAYLISQLKIPFSSLHGFIGLGDHFHPLFYLLAGVAYKLWSNASMLYILQALMSCLSAFPLYLSARFILKGLKLKEIYINFLALGVCFMYLFAISFQFLVTGEYNDAHMLALPLLFSLYFVITQNKKWFWIMFVLILLTKEEYSLLALPLAIYVFLKWKSLKSSVLIAVLGIAYFFALTFYVMPSISGTREYIFFSNQNRPSNLAAEMFRQPELFITKLFDDQRKRETVLISLVSFGFMPIFAPAELIVPATTIAIRFYDDSLPRRYEFNNQYAAGLIPPLAFGAIFGIKNLLEILRRKKYTEKQSIIFVAVILLVVPFYQDLVFHGPLNSVLKPQFYETQSWEKDAHELISQVPNKVKVASQNSLLPHLSQRESFYLLPNVGEAEYVVVDLAEGPNKFAPINLIEMERLVEKLKRDGFAVEWKKNKAILLRRVNAI